MTSLVQIIAIVSLTVVLLAVLDSIDKARTTDKKENIKKEGKK